MFFLFFFNDTATTEIYTLSLHDALPICSSIPIYIFSLREKGNIKRALLGEDVDRKSTRLNSSHSQISYAVFCLKKKKNNRKIHTSDLHHYRKLFIILRPHYCHMQVSFTQ